MTHRLLTAQTIRCICCCGILFVSKLLRCAGLPLAQVYGDAYFDRLFGPVACYFFRVNLGLGLLLGTLCIFPWTPVRRRACLSPPFLQEINTQKTAVQSALVPQNKTEIPIVTATFVGLADYMADGSLTQVPFQMIDLHMSE